MGGLFFILAILNPTFNFETNEWVERTNNTFEQIDLFANVCRPSFLAEIPESVSQCSFEEQTLLF